MSSMYSRSKSRSGAAMIIVLGLLGALMLMGVAFSIYMRIERTGASNYRYGVQARHIVWSGLASAIKEIDVIMTEPVGTDVMYPDWSVKASTGDSPQVQCAVMSKVAADQIPPDLAEKARKAPAYWHYLKDSSGVTRGRYGFVVINQSGLLDANLAGGYTRCAGTNINEIQLSQTPGVLSENAFINRRESQDFRYETWAELVEFSRQIAEDAPMGVYSLSPEASSFNINGDDKPKVYAGSNQGLWDEAKIKAALTECGIPNADLAYRNLRDYVDEDSVPQSLAEGCVERTPMINEVYLLYTISFDAAGTWTANAGVLIEWLYPFAVGSKETFNMHYDIEVVDKGTTPSASGSVPAGLAGSFDRPNITGGSASPGFPGVVDKPLPGLSGMSTEAVINVSFDLRLAAYIENSDGRVDEVPSPYAVNNGFLFSVNVSVPRGGAFEVTNAFEVCDPRFNWNPADGSQWYSSSVLGAHPLYTPSPGLAAPNFITKFYFDPAAYGGSDDNDLDDDIYMHVANRPLLSVGELGYICYAPWKTIRLYDHKSGINPYPESVKYHPVIDKFTLHADPFRRGVVNVNSTNENVIASVYFKMPQEEYSTNKVLTWAEAVAVEDAIESYLNSKPGFNYITNLSELGNIDWKALMSGDTEICKEAGIRNAAGLLTARQNIFTVIIRADSFSEGVGGNQASGITLATTRAIAEIWRDPVADSNGNHRCLVRYFRFLED